MGTWATMRAVVMVQSGWIMDIFCRSSQWAICGTHAEVRERDRGGRELLFPANGRFGGIRIPFQTFSCTVRNVLILDMCGGRMGIDVYKN